MNPNPLPPEGYQGPPGYPSSQPPVAINQDPNAQYFPPQPSEQARLPTEGNDAPPNTYMKPQPQPYNAYVKPPNVPPYNIPAQPVNQFVNVNQNVPDQQTELLKQMLEQQKIMREESKRKEDEREKKELEKKVHELEQNKLESEIRHLKDIQLATSKSGQNINVNNNVNTNVNNTNANFSPQVIYIPITRLQYNFGIYCLILFLNICMPGIGTIVAAIGWGRTVTPDKTGKLLCHGIFQLLTCIIIYGWIWAVVDALNYFEDGHWAC
jgi:hypothetical protein